ncbi:hypothetical protein AB674_16175 [Flavobacterium sp. ABG]|nr:hypothetical protein AB674_16175 [Flavobacterium sp. ABG]
MGVTFEGVKISLLTFNNYAFFWKLIFDFSQISEAEIFIFKMTRSPAFAFISAFHFEDTGSIGARLEIYFSSENLMRCLFSEIKIRSVMVLIRYLLS